MGGGADSHPHRQPTSAADVAIASDRFRTASCLTLAPDDENVVVNRAESDEVVDYRHWPFVLRERLGDSGSAALAGVFEKRDDTLISLVTERFERRLSEECGKLRSEIVQLSADLRVDIANARADFIKWSFLFWIGQAATVAGLLVALR